MNVPAALQLRAYYDRAPSTLATGSHDAHRLALLGIAMTVVATLIFFVVVGIIFVGLWRRRSAPRAPATAIETQRPIDVSENWWVLGGGLAMPVIVLAGVFLLTLSTMHAYAPAPPGSPEILVIGHQWWWEVRYPNDTVITANELHLPVGRAVRLELRSADVIHSFWAPNLEGKTDLIPGQQNEMVLRADSAGVYRAECAEFCGPQHAKMSLSIVAESADAYKQWLAIAKSPTVLPQSDSARAGLNVFMTHSCSSCHSIRGTAAAGIVGPDLTHFGSRTTLAGGSLPNTVGYLAGWISNPDLLKPGTKMPAIPMDGASLQAVVRYLEALK
ncbi:MAG TPA: cytochrome c oxidase subunit II [Gemmatimonadaceae bacterium]